MAWHGFMVDKGLQVEFRHALDATRVLKRRGSRTVGWWLDVSGSRVCLLKVGKRLGNHRRARRSDKQRFRTFLRVAKDRVDVAHDGGATLCGGRVRIPALTAQSFEPLLERAVCVSEPTQDYVHLGVEGFDLSQTHCVDLLGAHLGRRKNMEEVPICLSAVRQP